MVDLPKSEPIPIKFGNGISSLYLIFCIEYHCYGPNITALKALQLDFTKFDALASRLNLNRY